MSIESIFEELENITMNNDYVCDKISECKNAYTELETKLTNKDKALQLALDTLEWYGDNDLSGDERFYDDGQKARQFLADIKKIQEQSK